jgi:hypothetical protein
MAATMETTAVAGRKRALATRAHQEILATTTKAFLAKNATMVITQCTMNKTPPKSTPANRTSAYVKPMADYLAPLQLPLHHPTFATLMRRMTALNAIPVTRFTLSATESKLARKMSASAPKAHPVKPTALRARNAWRMMLTTVNNATLAILQTLLSVTAPTRTACPTLARAVSQAALPTLIQRLASLRRRAIRANPVARQATLVNQELIPAARTAT